MELSSIVNPINVVPIYAAILALIFIPITMRAGLYRVKTKIFIGDGGDPEMLRRLLTISALSPARRNLIPYSR